MKTVDATTAALIDKVREERDYARRCLSTALEDHHKAMTALGAELAASITERDTLRAALEKIQNIAFQF